MKIKENDAFKMCALVQLSERNYIIMRRLPILLVVVNILHYTSEKDHLNNSYFLAEYMNS